MARDLDVNTVPAVDQNRQMYFELAKGSGTRVLFVGNSVTKHEPKAEIGWYGDHGMCASCKERDYVHILMDKIREQDPHAAFGILQVAPFEWSFHQGFDIPQACREGGEFAPDVVILFFGANVDGSFDADPEKMALFAKRYEELRNFLCQKRTVTVIHCGSFWNRPRLDAQKRQVAIRYQDDYVDLGDFSQTEAVRDPKFNHPNDLGMEKIAQRIWQILQIRKFGKGEEFVV